MKYNSGEDNFLSKLFDDLLALADKPKHKDSIDSGLGFPVKFPPKTEHKEECKHKTIKGITDGTREFERVCVDCGEELPNVLLSTTPPKPEKECVPKKLEPTNCGGGLVRDLNDADRKINEIIDYLLKKEGK